MSRPKHPIEQKKLRTTTIESFFTPLKKNDHERGSSPAVVKSSETAAKATAEGTTVSMNHEGVSEKAMCDSNKDSNQENEVQNMLMATSVLSSPGFRSPKLSSFKDVDMLQATSSQAATPRGPVKEKRLLEDVDPSSAVGSDSEQSSKKLKSKSGAKKIERPVASIKMGKVIFTEKKLNLDMSPDTIHDLSQFYIWKQKAIDENAVYESFPCEHHSLIAKLVQDCDIPLSNLVRKICSKLFPNGKAETAVFNDNVQIIENVINLLAERKNYGLSESVVGCIWRWEVTDLQLFSESVQVLIQQRKETREKAKSVLEAQFETLSDEEKNVIITGNKNKDTLEQIKLNEKKQREQERLLAKEAKEKEKQLLKEEREKERNEKLLQKQKEREEEMLKKKQEKEKKLNAQPKISEFFKSKADRDAAGPTIILSDFETFFPDLLARPDITVAPVKRNPKIITIDSEYDYIERAKSFGRLLDKGNTCGKIGADAVIYVKNKRVKLLQYAENYRPGYFGTWNKISLLVSGRNPFIEDYKTLAYDVDSDEDWEEGDEEGEECLTDEEEEDIEEEEDLAENEDNWLVPHGYLSDDEGLDQDDEDPRANMASTENMQKKTEALIPIVYGPILRDEQNIPQLLMRFTISFSPMLNIEKSYDPLQFDTEITKPTGKVKKLFTDDMLPDLIEIISKSTKGIDKLVDEFRLKHGDKVSKNAIANKIKEIAVREKREGDTRPTWHIREQSQKQSPPKQSTSAQ